MSDTQPTLVEVGSDWEKRMVTQLNKKLFDEAQDILEEGCHLSHIGWSGVGKFIDHLENNYNITPKEGV